MCSVAELPCWPVASPFPQMRAGRLHGRAKLSERAAAEKCPSESVPSSMKGLGVTLGLLNGCSAGSTPLRPPPRAAVVPRGRFPRYEGGEPLRGGSAPACRSCGGRGSAERPRGVLGKPAGGFPGSPWGPASLLRRDRRLFCPSTGGPGVGGLGCASPCGAGRGQ